MIYISTFQFLFISLLLPNQLAFTKQQAKKKGKKLCSFVEPDNEVHLITIGKRISRWMRLFSRRHRHCTLPHLSTCKKQMNRKKVKKWNKSVNWFLICSFVFKCENCVKKRKVYHVNFSTFFRLLQLKGKRWFNGYQGWSIKRFFSGI